MRTVPVASYALVSILDTLSAHTLFRTILLSNQPLWCDSLCGHITLIFLNNDTKYKSNDVDNFNVPKRNCEVTIMNLIRKEMILHTEDLW